MGVTAMPHLTCVAHTRDEIGAVIDQYAAMGVENLLALHGDLPAGSDQVPSGHFERAIDLVAYVRARESWAIGVAAHPEGHPRAASREEDLTLTDDHWRVIGFMREYQAANGVSPDVRHVTADLVRRLGCDKQQAKALLFSLFPYGYVKQACKIAGMKRPRAWSTG